MKILLIRHGETEYNRIGKFAGKEYDVPLNSNGIKQAEESRKTLKSIDFDLIYSSTLERAKQTASVINTDFNKEIICDNRIVERDFGTLSGKTKEEVEKEVDLSVREYDYTMFGGESYKQVKARILDFISDIKQKNSNEVVLIVAHGGVVRMMHHLYGDKEIIKIENASIHEFDI